MKKQIIILVLFYAISSIFSLAWGYDGEVHSRLNKEAVDSSQNLDLLLKDNFGYPLGSGTILRKGKKERTIKDWIAYGGEAEDFGMGGENDYLRTRAFNHFHDPLKPWLEAGFDNIVNTVYRKYYGKDPVSPILWGLAPGMQDFPEVKNTTGDWSWGKTREYYYTFLTGKDFAGNTIAPTHQAREAAFADCFRGVGQIMHLLEDTSVPLHTRNDLHIFPITKIPFKNEDLPVPIGRWTYETFASKNIGFLDYTPDQTGDRPPASLLTDPNPDSGYDDMVPISGLFDRNQYTQYSGLPASNTAMGLAEYSNAYFMTQDTIWRHYPHPAKEDTTYADINWLTDAEVVDAEDGQADNRIYIKYKEGVGTDIEHLAAIRYFTAELDRLGEPTWLYLDKTCWKDYADKLIPRAVGYSAALLDYFFRGNFDIGVAQTQRNSQGEVTGIDIEVKNDSKMGDQATIEPLENGLIYLACQYTRAGQSEPVFKLVINNSDNDDNEVQYEITGANDQINSDYVPISVTFAEASYIPDGATDVSFTIIFSGKLGHEENAVAAKTFPINTSRIAYSYRPDGWPEPSHIHTLRPDGTDKRQITQAVNHIIDDEEIVEDQFFTPTWSPDGTMLAFESSYDKAGCGTIHSCSREIVVVDTTSEMTYPQNIVRRLTFYDTIQIGDSSFEIKALLHPSFSPDGSQIVTKVYATPIIFPLVIFNLDNGDWNYINDFEFWEQKQPSEIGNEQNSSTIAWSPQGDKIAYTVAEYHEETLTHAAFTDFDIYTINPDGTGDTRLTNDDFKNGDPSWSPDGEKIVFASNRQDQGQFDLWIMDKDGDNDAMIFDCVDYNCTNPSFSPDGQWIVFGYGETIHKFNNNGPGYDILETVGSASPSWCPVMTVYDPSF